MYSLDHTPTPWKVVSAPNFDNGLVYTSIQPVNVDEEAMKQLAMANGEYHVCRMSHTAAGWRFNYHRANAAFIVEAVNNHQRLVDEVAFWEAAHEKGDAEVRLYMRDTDDLIAKLTEALEWTRKNYAAGSTAEINHVLDSALSLAREETQ
jgi:hypothetical protein